MGDAEADAIRASRGDWVSQHLETYLASGGVKGHIMDIREAGGREMTTHCLIKCVGRKSGKTYIRPLIYGNVGGEIVVVASKGGADAHPEWYLNIVASETVGVQIATQAFEATWREPEGDERHDASVPAVSGLPAVDDAPHPPGHAADGQPHRRLHPWWVTSIQVCVE